MATSKYNEAQILELSKHPCIEKCSDKYIFFTDAFRKEAVRCYTQDMLAPVEIFGQFGFPTYIVHSGIPKDSLKRWRKLFKKDGAKSLEQKKR